MASYFDEHDCELSDHEHETGFNMLLQLARSLSNMMDFQDLGLVVDWDHQLPPPAAKAVVENLPRTVISSSQADLKCPVCLLEFEEAETVIELPCHHLFHSNCILPWLGKTNSCPLCRHELPTDDDAYEEHRRDQVGAGVLCSSRSSAASEPPALATFPVVTGRTSTLAMWMLRGLKAPRPSPGSCSPPRASRLALPSVLSSRLESSSGSTDWRTSTGPCTCEAARAGRSPSHLPRTLNPY